MENKQDILTITSKDISSQDLHDEEKFDPAKALSHFKNSPKIYVSLPPETATLLITEAVQARKFNLILAESPITFNYHDIQKLVYTQKEANGPKVLVNYALRANSKARELKQKIQEVLDKKGRISSITIESSKPSATSSTSDDKDGANQFLRQGIQEIDLLHYLTGQEVSFIQAMSSQSGDDKSSVNGFITISTKLSLGSQGIILLRSQEGEDTTRVRINFSNQSLLEASIYNADYEQRQQASNDKDVGKLASQDESYFASVEDAARSIRVFECAEETLKTNKSVYLKYVTKEVTPFRSVGTAIFLDIGLFDPSLPNKRVAITGLFSKKQDKIRKIFKKQIRRGEPLEFAPTFEKLIDVHYPVPSRPAIYIPSIPGDRKNGEMIDALKAGFVVFAEKPAFTNADMGRSFSQKLDPEWKKRLFFGWHYQHHFLYGRLLNDISKNTFGKIKHIRTSFVDPKIMNDENSRIFDPSQGGVGLDIYSYNLHFTLRLIDIENSYEVLESQIETAEHIDPSNPDLKEIDLIVSTKMKFGNGVSAELYANFSAHMTTHSEAEIDFEDGTKLFCKANIHFNKMAEDGNQPIVIQRPGTKKWEEYVPQEDMDNPEMLKTTYQQQVEFIRQQAAGEDSYDMDKDVLSIGVEKNIRFHEILDEILKKGGISKKSGA